MRIDERPIYMLNSSFFLWVIFSISSGNVLVELCGTVIFQLHSNVLVCVEQ